MVFCAVPVSLKLKGQQDGDAGNQVGNMIVKLPVQVADPVSCLLAVNQYTLEARKLFDESFENLMMGYIGMLPPAVANTAMKTLFNQRLMDMMPAQGRNLQNRRTAKMDSQVTQLQALRDNEFAVQVSGSGIPLIWGHCLLGSMEADDAAGILDFAQLSRWARLIRFDARGHGESNGSNNAREYAWDRQAEDVWAIAEHYAPGEKVILGGASMGSATALHAALKHPQKVAGLVLLLPPTAWRSRPRQARLYRQLARLIGVVSSVSKLAMKVLRLEPHGKPLRRALALAVSEHIGQAHPPWLRAALLGAAQSDLPDLRDLKRLQIPTAILTWEDDKAHPVSTAVALQSVLPDVRVYQVSSATDVDNWTAYIGDMLRTL